MAVAAWGVATLGIAVLGIARVVTSHWADRHPDAAYLVVLLIALVTTLLTVNSVMYLVGWTQPL